MSSIGASSESFRSIHRLHADVILAHGLSLITAEDLPVSRATWSIPGQATIFAKRGATLRDIAAEIRRVADHLFFAHITERACLLAASHLLKAR